MLFHVLGIRRLHDEPLRLGLRALLGILDDRLKRSIDDKSARMLVQALLLLRVLTRTDRASGHGGWHQQIVETTLEQLQPRQLALVHQLKDDLKDEGRPTHSNRGGVHSKIIYI